jgi:NADPH:quinone reductase-like Zn-dependent oxidoreductase
LRVFEIRDTWGLENLAPGERPIRDPGPREVLLRLRAASLNYRDLVVVQGNYGRLAGKPPLIPLSDGVGEVVTAGAEVTRVRPGDRVCTTVFQGWLSGELEDGMAETALGGPLDGVLGEYRTLHEDGVVRAPEHMSDAEAATLPCAGLTAWDAVINQGGLQAGETALILGTGGVSLFALQFAKLQGGGAIVTSKSDEKLARARRLGADHTINYVETPRWGGAVRELTGGRGVDLVIETGGGGTLPESLGAVRAGGRIMLMGVLAGAQLDAKIYHLVLRRIRLQGITMAPRDDFERMNTLLAEHDLHPHVDRIFGFDESPAAFEYLAAQRHFGKVAIEIAS